MHGRIVRLSGLLALSLVLSLLSLLSLPGAQAAPIGPAGSLPTTLVTGPQPGASLEGPLDSTLPRFEGSFHCSQGAISVTYADGNTETANSCGIGTSSVYTNGGHVSIGGSGYVKDSLFSGGVVRAPRGWIAFSCAGPQEGCFIGTTEDPVLSTGPIAFLGGRVGPRATFATFTPFYYANGERVAVDTASVAVSDSGAWLAVKTRGHNSLARIDWTSREVLPFSGATPCCQGYPDQTPLAIDDSGQFVAQGRIAWGSSPLTMWDMATFNAPPADASVPSGCASVSVTTLTNSSTFSPSRAVYLRWEDGRLNFFAGDPGSPFRKWTIVPNRPAAAEPVPPAWSSTTPTDETRYDLTVGSTATFTVTATDADGDLAAISKRYESADAKRTPRAAPAAVTCREPAGPSGSTRVLECSITPTLIDLAILVVDAVDSVGRSAGARRYLVGGSQLEYAALGDSYSAGEGVDPYFRDGFDLNTGVQTGTVDNRCHRSSRSYATAVKLPGATESLYERASGDVHAGQIRGLNKYGSDLNVRTDGSVRWSFLACSGAVIDNVLPEELGGYRQSELDGYREIHSQLSYPWVDYGTDLVTLTIGGNDAGFAGILAQCAGTACYTPSYERVLATAIDGLGPQLEKLYASVRTQTFGAEVLVIGYPQQFPESATEQDCPALVPFRGEQDFLRRSVDRMNSVIEEAAKAVDATYVDGASHFARHEVCGSEGEWINGPSATYKKNRMFTDDESFHPNLEGQRQYAILVNRALSGLPLPSNSP